jgi:hypothetical protein
VSKGCQKVVRNCQKKLPKKLSKSSQKVVKNVAKKLPKKCKKVVKKLSKSCKKMVKLKIGYKMNKILKQVGGGEEGDL